MVRIFHKQSFVLCCMLLVLSLSGSRLGAQNKKQTYPQLYAYAELESNNRMLFGFMDNKGKLVIKPQYYAVGVMYPLFSEGLAAVLNRDGQYGYINTKGQQVITLDEASVRDMGPFKEGMACIRKEDGTCYFINRSGQRVTMPEMDYAKDFNQGLAPAMPKGSSLMGYIDQKGRYVIEPRFIEAWSFSEELACVKARVGDDPEVIDGVKFAATYRFGYIDAKGNWVIDPIYIQAASFSEGLAYARTKSGTYLIDKEGKVVTSFDRDLMLPFYSERKLSNGLIPVVKEISSNLFAYGYANREGKMVIAPQYNYATAFVGGLARVYHEGKWAYIDTKGNTVWKGDVGLLRIIEKPVDLEIVEDDYNYDEDMLMYDDGVEVIEDTILSIDPIFFDPEFPGGVSALEQYIKDNLQYPELARDYGIEGKVFVQFTVETDGSISNVSLLRDIGAGCGEEAVRLVKSMPRWIPAKDNNGKLIRTEYNLPIIFKLKGK